MKKLLLTISLVICCAFFSKIYASHVMGADLTFQCTGPNTYLITLTAYRDCNGIALQGPLQINYSSAQCGVNSTLNLTQVGQPVDITPTCFIGTDACNGGGGYGIQQYVFQGTLTLPAGCGSDWVLSWSLCCRNAAITTLNNPGNDALYIEADLNNTVPNNSSPTFSTDPIAIYCENVSFVQQFNHGATTPAGDSLVYTLLPSLTAAGTPVAYNSPYSGANPLSTTAGTSINSQTGQLSFTPNQSQVAVMKVGVDAYRNGLLVAHVERDMQVIVTNCTNSSPSVGGINGQTGANANTYNTTACSNFCFTIQTIDTVALDTVFYSWVNTSLPGATITSSGGLKPLLTLCWAPTQNDVGTHNFVLQLRNSDCPYHGTASIAYTIVVAPSSDPPVVAAPDTTLCPGHSVNLTATSAGSVTSYTWSDGVNIHTGATWNVNPAISTVYTVTAVYSNGCQLTDQVTIDRSSTPSVTAFPAVSTICGSGDSVQVTASSTNAATYGWFPASGLSCTTCVAPKISPPASTVYSVLAYDSAGCPSDTFHVTVNLNPPPPQQSCAVIYASVNGTGTGTQASPASLATALSLAQCNNAVIKMDTGTYVLTATLNNIGSYTTLEGGFIAANNWTKTSTSGATTIYRDSLNLDGTGQTKRLMAIYINSAQYVRFQDLTIQTANCPVLASGDTFGYSNYVFYMINCSNYYFVRCQIIPGTATGGSNGASNTTTGAAGANGIAASGQAGGAAPAGPNAGGAGGNGLGHNSPGNPGSNGSGPAGGVGGAGGSNGTACANSPILGGGAGGPGGNGNAATGGIATSGASGATGSPGTIAGGFYVVGGMGGNGMPGDTGSGGGGGGATGGADYFIGGDNGAGGGSGGSGGIGGPAGKGGAGGGGCFGLFIVNNGANGILLECNIAAVRPGAGGAGGTGGAGGAGGIGGAGGSCGSCCTNTYGIGGNGGHGGNGGNGGSGSTGLAARVYIASGSALVSGDSLFSLVGQPTIDAANISCTQRNDTLSAVNSSTWATGTGATVPSGTAAQIITQYTTTGRKDITYSGNTYSGFVDIELDQNSFIPVIQSSAAVLNGDTFYVCQGSTANFNIQIASADTFDWNFGGATVPNTYTGSNVQSLTNLSFNTAGAFMILARIKTSCCGWSPYDTAYLWVEPQASLSYSGTTSFCPGDSAHIILGGTSTSYLWNPTFDLTDSTGANVYAYPQTNTIYLATGYSPRKLCNADTSISITKNLPATVTFTTVPAACGSTGSATAIPSPPGAYTYLWSPGGATTATISSQPSGTYYVTVTPQGSSCSVSASTSIGANGGLQAYMAKTISPICNGSCTGQLRVEAIGGQSPYSYQWSPTPSAIDSLNNLCAGTYTVTITDANSCTATTSQLLSQPLPLSVAVLDSFSPHCAGQCSGNAKVDGQGGTGPYSFLWSAPSTSDSSHAINLCVGPYTVTVTDANNCTAVGGVTITTPAHIIFDTVSTKAVSCFGGSDGAVTMFVSGGTSPYVYVWPQAPTIADSIATALAAGTYTPMVTDSFNCKDTFTVVINQPPPLGASSVLDSISCYGLTDGSITATGTGGVSPYTYALDGSGTFQASGSFTGLASGPHQVTVQDAHGCDTILNFVVFEPTPVTSSIVSTVNDSCFGSCAGVIVAAGSGGVPPYQYSINGGAYSASDTLSGLCANPSYSINVKDNHGCPAAVLPDAITQPLSSVVPAFVSATPPTCNNGANGSFTVNASGGTPGYTFSSDGGPYQASGSFSPEAFGNHLVTVKDAYNCTATLAVSIPNPPATSFYTTSVSNVLCFGSSTGSVALTLTGSTTPYTFSWSNGASTQNISNLPADTFTVVVTDGNGCIVFSADSTNIITQPTQISATDVMTPVSCYGGSDGALAVAPSGGVPPITHSWSNGATTATITGLPMGTYSDTLTDQNGCKYTDANIAVTQPSAVAIIDVTVTPVACLGQNNGSISLSDTGGTPGYQYIWSNGGTTDPLNGLSEGPYTVTVTDTHNCTDTASIYVGTAPSMYFNAEKNNVLCPPLQNGAIYTPVTGGTPPYQFQWSNGATDNGISSLPIGVYSVTVTDSRACVIDTSFVLINDSSFHAAPIPGDTATINEGDQLPLGLVITSNPTGDNAASITWTPTYELTCSNCQAPIASPLTTTHYEIEIVSDSGCVIDTGILITVIPQHQLYVPNAFTPNGNGINDYWTAFGNKKVWKLCQMSIYDRWGELIYESNDIDFQWDGRYRGQLVEPGLYVYIFKLTFIDGYTVTNKGSITLIR